MFQINFIAYKGNTKVVQHELKLMLVSVRASARSAAAWNYAYGAAGK